MTSTVPHSPPARDEWVGWVLVSVQLSLLGTLCAEALRRLPALRWWRGVPATASMLAGGAVALWGAGALGGALRAHPAPAAEAVLRTDGAYRWVRHPIYSGVLLASAGASAAAGTWRALGALAALVALFQVKARYEEGLLRARFPGYAAYAARTPRFVPWRRDEA
jgi:protein-S-isoprenylcysteine O-methyltransferase Ste14